MPKKQAISQAVLDLQTLVEPCYKAQNKLFGPYDHELLADLIQTHAVKSMLDVGTGGGSFIREVAKLYPHLNIEALDGNALLIQMAQKQSKNKFPNLTFKNQLFDQNYAKKKFDLITARFAVEHMNDPLGFVKCAKQRLKTTGKLLIIEYLVCDGLNPPAIWKEFRKSEIKMYKHINSNHQVSHKLPAQLKKAGFKNITNVQYHISPSTDSKVHFYKLVEEYAKLYHTVAPTVFSKALKNKVCAWAKKQPQNFQNKDEPRFYLTHTLANL